MGVYKIIHKEELVGTYFVDACDEQEALNVWNSMVSAGGVDFSDMELVDSSDEAVLDEPEWECAECMVQHSAH